METQRYITAVLLVASLLGCVQGGRILAVFAEPAESHMMVFSPYVQELAKRGNEVTVIGSFPLEKPLKNYRDIDLKLDFNEFIGHRENFYEMADTYPLLLLSMSRKISKIFSNRTLEHPEVQALIQSDEHFDVVIIEAFLNDAMYGFAHRFNAPIVGISSLGAFDWIFNAIGGPHHPAYVPDLDMGFSDHMTFGERFSNTFYCFMSNLGRNWIALPQEEAIMKEGFKRFEPLPSITELQSRTSLVLLNQHVSVSYPQPMLPNMIQVAGLHFKPTKKLPEDLQTFLDEAKDGVIYFSMGSNLKSADIPLSKRSAILEVFSKLKQRVLWKWEDDNLPGKSANVKVSKWLPQQDILAHPNVRVFMTHGGLLSTLESVQHGVPVVGIPIMADQQLNIKKAVDSGYGLKLAFKELTAETLGSTLHQVLDDPKYRDAAKRLSAIFRDRPMSALDEAVYWTEYVMRHKGTAHMRSAALDLTWYQYLLLDVLAVVVLASVTALLLIVFVLRRLARVLCGRKSQVKPDKKSTKKIN